MVDDVAGTSLVLSLVNVMTLLFPVVMEIADEERDAAAETQGVQLGLEKYVFAEPIALVYKHKSSCEADE